MISSVMFSREYFFCRASPSVRSSVVVFFLFLTESVTKWGITNDQYSDGRIPSGKMLLTDFVPYTDRFNPSVKLFNGVVIKADHAQDRLLSSIK